MQDVNMHVQNSSLSVPMELATSLRYSLVVKKEPGPMRASSAAGDA